MFKLSPTGTETVLYTFTGGADGGPFPSGLVQDAAGNLYGTTYTGGERGDCAYGACGVVFELIRCDSAPTGYDYKVLYTFTGGADGANPYASLVRDTAGNLYGTTYKGGVEGCKEQPDCGVVFKLSPSGTATVLHSFTGGADGANPQSGLTLDAAGNLYGVTPDGGAYPSACGFGCGVVFRLALDVNDE